MPGIPVAVGSSKSVLLFFVALVLVAQKHGDEINADRDIRTLELAILSEQKGGLRRIVRKSKTVSINRRIKWSSYSQTGARFGCAMWWVMLFCFPLMAAIQEISARMGRTTGRGIAGNRREKAVLFSGVPYV
jgi:hypothetical protein